MSPRRMPFRRRRKRRRSVTARSAARAMIRELPNFLRLLAGLVRDRRVSILDKALFGFVVLYVLTPTDLIPDFVGLLGLFDDVYLVGLALSRLLLSGGTKVLLEHWRGDPRDLGYLLEQVGDIGSLLPGPIRRTLARAARRAR